MWEQGHIHHSDLSVFIINLESSPPQEIDTEKLTIKLYITLMSNLTLSIIMEATLVFLLRHLTGSKVNLKPMRDSKFHILFARA